jgi:hypothetical protein
MSYVIGLRDDVTLLNEVRARAKDCKSGTAPWTSRDEYLLMELMLLAERKASSCPHCICETNTTAGGETFVVQTGQIFDAAQDCEVCRELFDYAKVMGMLRLIADGVECGRIVAFRDLTTAEAEDAKKVGRILILESDNSRAWAIIPWEESTAIDKQRELSQPRVVDYLGRQSGFLRALKDTIADMEADRL